MKRGTKRGRIEGQQTLLEQLYAEGVLSREEYERRPAALLHE
jgi:hypothetical protein